MSFTNTNETEWYGVQYQDGNWSHHSNLTQQFNQTLLNFTNTTLLEEEEGPSLGIVIVAIFMMVVLSLVLLACVILFFVIFCYECQNRNTVYIGYRHRFSDTDSNYSVSSYEESNSYQNRINKKHIVFEPNKNLLQETPLDEIIIHDTEIDEINCPICLEPIILNDECDKKDDKAVQLSCQHIYHQKCISTWYFNGVTSVSKCPLCREKMDHTVITVDSI